MKIVYIDTIIFDLQNSGGISVYWYEIINRILNDKEFEVYFIVSRKQKNNIFWERLNIPEERKVVFDKLLNRYRVVNYKEDRPHYFISSYYRYSKNKNAKNITIIHDFTYEYFVKGIKQIVHHFQKMRAISKSYKNICISQNTQKDLLKFGRKKYSSVVIYNGVSDAFRILTNEEKIIATQNLPKDVVDVINKKYVLFIGQRGGYKNWVKAVALFRTLPKEYYMVSVGGGQLTIEEKEALLGIESRHIKAQALTEEQICLLYNNAYCLLYLSEYEGFGIPIAEAQQCGCPVLALNKSSIPEVAGKNDSILIKNEFDSIPLGLEHYPPIKRFSWDITYKQIIKELS